MERALPPISSSVIEVVVDVTTFYDVTLKIRTTRSPPPARPATAAAALFSALLHPVRPAKKAPTPPRHRPVATVRPLLATGTPAEGDARKTPPASQAHLQGVGVEASLDLEAPREDDKKAPETPQPTEPLQEEHKGALNGSEKVLPCVRWVADPCRRHRDYLRGGSVVGKKRTTPPAERVMEECHNGEGCGEELGHFQENHDHDAPTKETTITECLDEFLESLQLAHLGNYLRVLGCTCVRDLKLLERPELDAIQLIARRRLLKQLESLNLHHEAPPSDCSLEGWLTWYGLTHISGFLAAIGVHTVQDLGYLREEDLELLKPVTRRRILNCYRK